MTSDEKAGMARLMLRWPDRRDQLRHAVSLASLYECYALACDAAHWWSKQPSSRGFALAREYINLVTELEAEVATELSAYRSKQSASHVAKC